MIAIRREACRGLSIKVALQVFSLMKEQDMKVHLFGHGLIPQFLDIFQGVTTYLKTPESVIRATKITALWEQGKKD